MTRRAWLITAGLLVVLLVVPPIPGFWLNFSGSSAKFTSHQVPESLGELIFNPLRLLGSLLAVSWVHVLSHWPQAKPRGLVYAVVFLIAGVSYAAPHWISLIGPMPSWGAALWTLPVAIASEWAELHAPLAGVLSLGAFHLLRTVPEPEPVGIRQRILNALDVVRGR